MLWFNVLLELNKYNYLNTSNVNVQGFFYIQNY